MGYNDLLGIPKSNKILMRDGDITYGLSPLFSFSSDFGTVTNVNICCQRRANSLIVKGTFVVGTVAAVVGAYLILPLGLQIDKRIYRPGIVEGDFRVGSFTQLFAGGTPATLYTGALYAGVSVAGNRQISFTGQTKSNEFDNNGASSVLGSGDTCFVSFEVPIEQWKSR